MGHSHAHSHRPAGGAWRPLMTVFGLNGVFFLVELLAGFWTNSLALIADAGHMLVDMLAVGLALFAMWIARKPATARNTYGYHRVEILAALVNGVLLWGLTLGIWWEAWGRLTDPPQVMGGPMLAVAVVGLGVNGISAWMLARVAHANLNVRGAFLHVLFDVLGSVAAIAAGIAVVWKGWVVVDPVLSIATAALIVWGAWKLIQEAVQVLMEGVPAHVEVNVVREALLGVPGIRDVHDLHVWTLTSGVEAMTGHAVITDVKESQEILVAAHRVLHDRFHIDHMTLQLETRDLEACEHPAYHQ